MIIQNLLYLADSYITLEGLKDSVTGAAITNATVTVSLAHKRDGTAVTGQTWPLTLPHAGGGTYRAQLVDTLAVEQGEKLDAVVIAETGQARREWAMTLWVRDDA